MATFVNNDGVVGETMVCRTIKIEFPELSKGVGNEAFSVSKDGMVLYVSIVPKTSPELDELLNKLSPFAIRTVLGTHKKSLSFRNAYKFRIQCVKFVYGGESILTFQTSIMFVNNEYVIYKFILRQLKCF